MSHSRLDASSTDREGQAGDRCRRVRHVVFVGATHNLGASRDVLIK